MSNEPSSVTKDELLKRAEEMIPRLLERGAEADRARRLPDSTVADLIENHFFSIVAPRRCGGMEFDLDVLLAVAKTLGRGCGSTAWVTSLLGTHNWMAGLFPLATQDELFADKGYLLAPAIFAPSGSARQVDGGFRVSGRWCFGSGISHSDWIFVSALRSDAAENIVGMECLVLPVKEIEVLDTWHTVGMRGTGSHDVVIDDVFVPEHRAIPFADVIQGTAIGASLSANPSYRIPLVPYLSYTAAAPALGIGFGALDQFTNYLQQRTMMGGEKQKDKVSAHARLGEAQVALAAAEALLDRGVADLLQKAKSGHPFSIEDRVAYRAEACYIATIAKRSVDSMLEAAGAKAQFETHPLQRFQRDINTLRGHVVFDMDSTMEVQGRVLLGLEPNQPLL